MPVAIQPNGNKVAHAIATHGRMATSEWRHKVKIKNLLIDEPTHESIDAICSRAKKPINAAADSEDLRRDQKDDGEREYFVNDLVTRLTT